MSFMKFEAAEMMIWTNMKVSEAMSHDLRVAA